MRKLWFLVPLTGLVVALALSTSASAVRRVKLAAGVSVTQPTVTGTARVGDVVSVGEPAGAVSVAWDQCGNTTKWCGEIPASVGQWSYTIPASEQGFYLRAQVTGPSGAVGVSNVTAIVAKAVVTSSSSSSSSSSTSTSTTTSPTSTTSSTTTTPSSSSTTTTSSTTTSGGSNCAGTPGSASPNYASMDACGFPSPDTTGVPAGTTLTPSGSITASTPGQVISDLQINGSINVTASNVVIKDDNITSSSQTGAIRIESGVTGVQVEYDTIHGDGTTSGNLQAAVYNTNYSDAANAVTIDHVDFYDGQRIMHGPGTLTNSFCLDNMAVSGAHYECVYEGGGGVVINHNTLLTAFTQTAAVFVSTDFAALTNVQITNNLLAGGGYVIYGDATNEHNYGIQSETITGNYFSAVYYPDSGYYGPDDGEYLPSVAVWSGNVNDSGQTVGR